MSGEVPFAAASAAPSSQPIEPAASHRADTVRALAITLVVVLHVAAPVVVRYGAVDGTAWWTANLFDALARPSVPLFVMVSGMLLLAPQRVESIGAFLRRRGARLLLPFAGWAAAYFAWRAYYHGHAISVPGALKELIEGPVYVHFWFVYMILGLYLVAPILRAFLRSATRAELMYLLGLWLLAVALLPTLGRFAGLRPNLPLTTASGFLGYFLLGHVLGPVRLGAVARRWAVALLLLAVAVTALGAYFTTVANAGAFDPFFYEYLSPNVIVASVAAFLLLGGRGGSGVPGYRGGPCAHLARSAFGIYLSHLIVLELLQGGLLGFTLRAETLHPLIGIPLTTAVIMVLCLALLAALRASRVLRFMAG